MLQGGRELLILGLRGEDSTVPSSCPLAYCPLPTGGGRREGMNGTWSTDCVPVLIVVFSLVLSALGVPALDFRDEHALEFLEPHSVTEE